jgi:hypothetical protein
MIKSHKEEEVKEVDIIDSIVCNRCGKEVIAYNGMCGTCTHNFEIQFGWGSKRDTDIWKFDLCEKCLEDFVSTFKIPVEENIF